VILHPSPNFNDRPANAQGRARYLVLHYTGMASGGEALARLSDPKAQVSAHYLIEEDGRLFKLVEENKRAWHAGVSSWEGEADINGHSIGIELVNPGHDSPGYIGDYRPFPERQMAALIPLCQDIIARHDIKPWHVLGHSDVAPGRKIDPGELFDWPRLAKAGVGLWPDEGGVTGQWEEAATMQKMLRRYGYGIEVTGDWDQQTSDVVAAFHRHFRPYDHTASADEKTEALLSVLLQLKKADY
tara:strand:- start:5303 stop:6031 length:729 start_codon:yes stop_codon:yes gene_type:complete